MFREVAVFGDLFAETHDGTSHSFSVRSPPRRTMQS